MARTIFIYGMMVGVLILMLLGFGMGVLGLEGGVEGMVWTYASMIVGFSLMFVGVRRFADAHGGLNFGGAFIVSLGIAIVASLIYTLGWEAYLAATDYRFADQYTSQMMAAKIAENASAAELARLQAQMAHFKVEYANPLFRLGMTFMEIAPVGLLLALIAGATIRTRRDDDHSLIDDD